MDRIINGLTPAQRRKQNDALRPYDKAKLKANVARAILDAKNKEEHQEKNLQERKEKRNNRNDINAPLWKIWAVLKPNWRILFTKDWRKFEFEAIAMLAICGIRLFEFRMQTGIIRTLDGTLNSRNYQVFRGGLIKATLVQFGGAVLSIIYGYIQSQLTWKWRYKLTNLLHEQYFRNMNYYYIGAGGGKEGLKMDDPDTRIVADLSQTVNGFANMFSNTMHMTSTGVLYTSELWRTFGWKFAVAPYCYLLLSHGLVKVIIPMQKRWRRRGRARGVSWGKYRFALQRMELQGESIAALKGGEREYQIVEDEFAVHMHDCHMQHLDFLTFHSVWNFFMQHGCSQFVSIFCIGRGIWYPKYENIDTIEKMADVRAEVGVQWMLFNYCMNAAREALNLVNQMHQLIGTVERVTEMMEMLETVQEHTKSHASKSIVADNCIAFEKVSIITPRDVMLVENLSFRLEAEDSLLIVGHNGAGKSSIFRCLGGLWSVPSGVIRKPGGRESNMANDSMFYIPQKPYNVMGTLKDQMTYPEVTGGADITKEKMVEILREVDLEYLVERKGALDMETNWEDELSLSEKQRLAIARLVYHKPKFAILDECSSAITSHMEERLYRICLEQGITYITIAHRPALQAYHRRMLSIGDGKCGFTMHEIENIDIKAKVKDMAKASIVPKDIEASTKKLQKERSKLYEETMTIKDMPQRGTFGRMMRIWHICKPNWWVMQSIGVLLFIGIQVKIEDYGFGNMGKMYGALTNRDANLMFRLARNGLICGALQGWIWEQMLYFERELGNDMSNRLERHLAQRLSRNNHSYRMSHVDRRIKDIDHRVSMDAGILVRHNIGQLLIGSVRPITKIFYFTYRINQLMGWQWPCIMFAYYFVSTYSLTLCMPDFRKMHRKSSQLDSKFQFVHARVKTCAESIAFFDGGLREQVIVEGRFRELMAHQRHVLDVDTRFNIIKNVFESRIPDILQWIIRFSYGYFYGGTDEEILADGGAALNEGHTYVMTMIPQIFHNVGAALSLATRFAEMAGKIDRTAELQEILDELEDEDLELANLKKLQEEAEAAKSGADGDESLCIKMEHMDIVTPGADCIASDVSFEVTEGKALMITGRGGTGKTSFARVIAGLWPVQNGILTVPKSTGDNMKDLQRIFIVPQRIHMALGTLADQVTYPDFIPVEERTEEDEARLQSMLDLVGIGYLVERWGGDADETHYEDHKGWDHLVRWEDVLSLGEQQRMGVARMYYHNPKFAVLDECTSAVSVDVEEKLYSAAVARGITCITLSQHMTLPKFNPQQITIGENSATGWSIHAVDTMQENKLMSGSTKDAMHAVADLH